MCHHYWDHALLRSGYVSEHRNPVPQRYRSEHSMRTRQLFLVGSYFRSNTAAEHVVVTFRLKVGDAFDSLGELQTKIKEIEDRSINFPGPGNLLEKNCL